MVIEVIALSTLTISQHYHHHQHILQGTIMIYAKQQASSSSSSSSTTTPSGSPTGSNVGETSPAQTQSSPRATTSPAVSTSATPPALPSHSIVSIIGESITSNAGGNNNNNNGSGHSPQSAAPVSPASASAPRFGPFVTPGEAASAAVATSAAPIVRPGLEFPGLLYGQQPAMNLTNYAEQHARAFGTEANAMAGASTNTTSTMADSSTSVSNLTSSNSALLRSLQEGAGPSGAIPPPLSLPMDPLASIQASMTGSMPATTAASSYLMMSSLQNGRTSASSEDSFHSATSAMAAAAAGLGHNPAGVPTPPTMPAFPQIAVVPPFGSPQPAFQAELAAAAAAAVSARPLPTATTSVNGNHHHHGSGYYSNSARHNGNSSGGGGSSSSHRSSHRNGCAPLVGAGAVPVGVCRPLAVNCNVSGTNGHTLLKMGMPMLGSPKGADLDSARHPKCSKCRNHGQRVAVKSKSLHFFASCVRVQ